MNVKAWLSELYYGLGYQSTNFALQSAWINKEEETCFSKRSTYLDLIDMPYGLNQRQMLKNEVILDMDDGSLQDYHKFTIQLEKTGFKFYAYATKSGRSRHISLYYNRMFLHLKRRDRQEMRYHFQESYGCDTQLSSESHMIQLEYTPHFKTNEIKKLIYCNKGINNWRLK